MRFSLVPKIFNPMDMRRLNDEVGAMIGYVTIGVWGLKRIVPLKASFTWLIKALSPPIK